MIIKEKTGKNVFHVKDDKDVEIISWFFLENGGGKNSGKWILKKMINFVIISLIKVVFNEMKIKNYGKFV